MLIIKQSKAKQSKAKQSKKAIDCLFFVQILKKGKKTNRTFTVINFYRGKSAVEKCGVFSAV